MSLQQLWGSISLQVPLSSFLFPPHDSIILDPTLRPPLHHITVS